MLTSDLPTPFNACDIGLALITLHDVLLHVPACHSSLCMIKAYVLACIATLQDTFVDSFDVFSVTGLYLQQLRTVTLCDRRFLKQLKQRQKCFGIHCHSIEVCPIPFHSIPVASSSLLLSAEQLACKLLQTSATNSQHFKPVCMRDVDGAYRYLCKKARLRRREMH